MSTTAQRTQREQRARHDPLRARHHAPGMFVVENFRTGSEYVVDIQGPACQCRDFEFRMGPANGECKHIAFVRLVAAGELCPTCGYSMCRPSCPSRK